MRSADTTSRDSGATPERGTESVLRAVCLRLGCTAATAVFPARGIPRRLGSFRSGRRLRAPAAGDRRPGTGASLQRYPQAGRHQQAQAHQRRRDRLQAGVRSADRARRIRRRPDRLQSSGRAELRRIHRAAPRAIRTPAGAQRHAGSRLAHRPAVLGWIQEPHRIVGAYQRRQRDGLHALRRHRSPAPRQRRGRLLRR